MARKPGVFTRMFGRDDDGVLVLDGDDPEKKTWNPVLALKRLTSGNRYGSSGDNEHRATRLTPTRLEAVFRQEPLLRRCILKVTSDMTRNGFTIIDPESGEALDADAEVQEWFRDGAAWTVIREALIAAHVYGDGYVEIEREGADEDPLAPTTTAPVRLYCIDPVGIRLEGRKGIDGHVLVQDGHGSRPIHLHPDRYHHFRVGALPGYKHGISTVESAYHAAIARIKGLQGIGETLYFSGVPKVALMGGPDASNKDLDNYTAAINDPDFVRGWVFPGDPKVQQLNPSAINPKDHFEALDDSIAAAVGLPTALAKGAKAGAVTGSETNQRDYHADLHGAQRNILEPLVSRVVRGLTGLTDDQFDVRWEPFPVSPFEEASELEKRTNAYALLRSDPAIPASVAARIAGLDVMEDDVVDDAGLIEEPADLPDRIR